LSHGRVGISIASGWAPPDFAIKPENFDDAKSIMFESAKQVQQLWRGETLEFPGPSGNIKVQTLPRPIQKELPIWVTTAGNIDSFTRAGEMGANVLTHLLGQTIEEVAEKVAAYRHAWQKAGHSGRGLITVMLHTFAGPNEQQVEDLVREPMKNYLKSAMFLVKSAAWQFPAFKQLSEEQGKTLDDFFETISEQDMDDLLEFSFQRYFSTSGLFGTPEGCQKMVEKVYQADCDEIACLIDFGIDTEIVLEHLPYLNQVRELAQATLPTRPAAQQNTLAHAAVKHGAGQESDYSLPALLARRDVTHFQCTPSMATMLAADEAARPGLAKLKQMMVGGEAFPPALAAELAELVEGRVSNMYGPTETTIWSSSGDVQANGRTSVSIGTALANQSIYILDERQQQLPAGIPGELVIGGEGVVRGYYNRPELNEQRFLPDPFSEHPDARMYRTGDLACYREDGQL
ncbi:MAG: LLM class flavin-dependent oxidoreductase, partial [Pseudomonadales bacterium]|nr:LLM class flavin-dependent oxidoreductase [Pseudomonadales bacterium]